MVHRTIDKTLITPAIARSTVCWAMRSAANNRAGSYYALIAARVFTAFMFEGVINHLGEKLCSTWNRDPHPLARQTIEKRHKAVRKYLQLANGGLEYQELSLLVSSLSSFRDSFAHPRVCQQVIHDSVPSELAALPNIAWESEVDASNIERDYHDIEAYCMKLLETAAMRLESIERQGYYAWQAAYPHLANPAREAAYLRGFLLCPSYTSADLVPEVAREL